MGGTLVETTLESDWLWRKNLVGVSEQRVG